MNTKFKILSAILSMALFVNTLCPATVKAADNLSEIVTESTLSEARSNIQFIEGNPGDTHLVYTYTQNGNVYKSVENASSDFKEVECKIYVLNENNTYSIYSTQHVSIDSKGNPNITIDYAKGGVEQRVIDVASEKPSLSKQAYTTDVEWEWVTEYRDGSKANLKNLAISALISAIAAIACFYSSGALAAASISAVNTIAQGLFGLNADRVYYHKIINWRHSPKSYFVIDETEWTEFYSDSRHTNYLGYTYAEYIF